MKKTLCFIAFLCLAKAAFANDVPGRSIFVEGTAPNAALQQFFQSNFSMEAAAMFYDVKDTRDEAAFTFRFTVAHNTVTWADGSVTAPPAGEPQFAISINFIRNVDDMEIVGFSHFFTDYEEMFEYNQFLIFRAIVLVPPDELQTAAPVMAAAGNPNWQFPTFALRVSLDFQIVFNNLQQNSPAFSASWDTSPHANSFMGRPGATFGFEMFLLNWMSLEPNLQISMEEVHFEGLLASTYVNTGVGLRLKFPIRFVPGTLLSPYAAFSYSLTSLLNPPYIYYNFPPFAVGGGLQFAFRAGGSGAVFLNVSVMRQLGEVLMHNFSMEFPNPYAIPFQRYAVRIGLGYSFALSDRRGGVFSR
ncbi:MAG: hypothetical protein FWG66_00375 [Spirochaetes bacterium]|nr:hypothetical protein [Spirochaetota bacterium]